MELMSMDPLAQQIADHVGIENLYRSCVAPPDLKTAKRMIERGWIAVRPHGPLELVAPGAEANGYRELDDGTVVATQHGDTCSCQACLSAYLKEEDRDWLAAQGWNG